MSVEEDLKDPLFLKKKTEAQDWYVLVPFLFSKFFLIINCYRSMSQLLDKLNSFARF